jgi:hypothetical protein
MLPRPLEPRHRVDEVAHVKPVVVPHISHHQLARSTLDVGEDAPIRDAESWDHVGAEELIW